MRTKIFLVIFLILRLFGSSVAQPLIDSLKFVSTHAPHDTIRAKAYYDLAIAHWDSAYDKTIHYFEQSLKIAQKRDSWKDIADIHHRIAMVYFNQGELNKSLLENQNSLSVYKIHNDSKGIGDVTNSIGVVYKAWGKYQKALENFFIAREEYEKIGDSSGIGMTSNNIGQIFFYQEDYPKAIEHFTSYYEISKANRIPFAMAGSANNIAASLVELYQHQEAIKWYKEAADIYDSLDIAMGVAIINDNIGSLLAKDHDYEQALEFHQKAIKVFSDIGNKSRLAHALSNVGYVYYKLKQYSDALLYLKRAQQISEEIKHLETLKRCHLQLSLIYEVTNNYSMALEHHKHYVELKDSLMNIELNETLSQSELKHKSEQQQTELTYLSQKVQQSKLFILTLALFAILFVGLWVVLIIFNQKKKQRLAEYSHTIHENIKQLDETALHTIPIPHVTHQINWPDKPSQSIRLFDYRHKSITGQFVVASQKLPLNYLAYRLINALNSHVDTFSQLNDWELHSLITESVSRMGEELHIPTDDYSLCSVVYSNGMKIVASNTAVIWVSTGEDLLRVDGSTNIGGQVGYEKAEQLFMLISAVENINANYISLVEIIHKTLKLLLHKPEETQREIIRSTIESWSNSVDEPYDLYFTIQKVRANV